MRTLAPQRLNFWGRMLGVAWVFLYSVCAHADTNAITPQHFSGIAGYVNGGAGFAFTPTTNLAVTKVGYWDQNEVQPVITFWSGTNYPFASFPLAAGTGSGLFISTNVSLQLFAGQRYVVLLNNPGATVSINVYDGFQTAPQLSGYTSLFFLTASNAFQDDGAGYYFAGPGFSFTNLPVIAPGPTLKITRTTETNALLAWASSPAGFVLQQNGGLTTTNWILATNTVTAVNGTNQVSTSTKSGNLFFRLLHP